MTRKTKVGCLVTVGIAIGLVIVVAIAAVVFLKRQAGREAAPLPDVKLPAGSTPLADVRMYFDSDRSGNFELFTMGHDGSSPTQITDDPRYDSWWPRLSPDRTRILFYRSPAGSHDRDFTVTSLWMANADGTGLVQVLPVAAHGWWQQGHAEWSPDGSQLVMFGGSRINPQIFITDALGREPRPLTDRGGSNLDPSWSPDGRVIYFIGCPENFCTPSDYEVYSIPVSGRGDATRLTDNDVRDHDPYVSPDDESLAWLVERSGGSQPVWGIDVGDRSARNAREIPDDTNITSLPRWSADSELIYSHRLDYSVRDPKFEIIVMRPDGSGLTTLTAGQPGNNEYPSP